MQSSIQELIIFFKASEYYLTSFLEGDAQQT